MTPEEQLRKAGAAERLFRDAMLQETLDVMERDVMEAWIACPVRDMEGREELYRLIKTTRKFRDLLRGTMESGKLAAEKIRQEKESLAAKAKAKIRSFTQGRGY